MMRDSFASNRTGVIAIILQNNGIDVKLIDAVHQRMPLTDLIDTVTAVKPDFIATNFHN